MAWDWAKNIYKLKNADEATFYSPIETELAPAPTSKSPEEREAVVDSGASKGFELNSAEIQEPHNFGNGQWRSSNERGTQVHVHDLDLFVTVQILDDTPAVA